MNLLQVYFMCILIPKQIEMFAGSAGKGRMKNCLGNFLWMKAVVFPCTSIAWYEIIMTHYKDFFLGLHVYNPRVFEFQSI